MTKTNQPIHNALESSLWIENELRRRFLEDAQIKDPVVGYVSVPSVNQRIDLEMQGWAADLIVNHFLLKKHIHFDIVVGIPNSGIPLGTAVAERLGIPLAPGRKGKDYPGAWNMPVIVNQKVPSFTTGIASQFVFNGIKKGDTVLAVEDVIANGETMSLIAEKLQEQGVRVCLASYFSKMFQGGIQKLRNMHIETFCAIGIEKIYQENNVWKLALSPPLFSDNYLKFK